MNSGTKIVFIHQGHSWYLPYALYQARSVSPGGDVVLLADSSFKGEGIISCELKDFQNSQLEAAFRKVYLHLSTNSESFELICFLRWYYLLEYMLVNNVAEVFCFDSDVLLYSSVPDLIESYDLKSVDCGYLLFGSSSECNAASAGTSFWTRDSLANFCEFIVQCYSQANQLAQLKDFYSLFLSEGRFGGVCDMTLLYMFWQEKRVRARNLLVDSAGNVFDQNINQGIDCGAGDFDLVQGKKKVRFINSKPVFYRKNIPVRAHLLHFQGEAKGDMPLYYTGGWFKDKVLYDLKGVLYRIRRDIRGKKF